MSRWLFFPSPASSATIELSGTVTNVGSWYVASNNTTSTPSSGVTYLNAMNNGSGLRFYFSTQTERDAFESAYPDGVGQWNLEVDGETVVAPAGWVWNHSSGTTITDVRQNQFSSFLANYPYTGGDSFSVTLT